MEELFLRFIKEHDTGEDLCLQSLGPSSLTLSCALFSADKPLYVNGLVDSGCSGLAFISQSLVQNFNLPIKPLSQPRQIRLADGGNSPGRVTHIAFSYMGIGEHYEPLVFLVAKLGSDVILGYPWLQRHNPAINFSSNDVLFNSTYCISHCLSSGSPLQLKGTTTIPPLQDSSPTLPAGYQRPAVEDTIDIGEPIDQPTGLSPPDLTYTMDFVGSPDINTIGTPTTPEDATTPEGATTPTTTTGFRLLTEEEAYQRLHPPHPQPVVFTAGCRRHVRHFRSRSTPPQTLDIKAFSNVEDAATPIRISMLAAAPMATFCRQKGAHVQWTTLHSLFDQPKVFYGDIYGQAHHTPQDNVFHQAHTANDIEQVCRDTPEEIYHAILTDSIDLDEAKELVPSSLHDFLTYHYSQIHLNKMTEADIMTFHEKQQKQPYTLDQLQSRVPSQYHDFINVFLKQKSDELPPHRPFDTKIQLKENAQPPYSKTRPFSSHEQTVVKAYIDELLSKGFIRRSTSPAAAPVLLAKKPGGGIRICVDYRGLNDITIRNRFPLPLVHDTLEQMRHAKFFTKLDVIAAFNKIRIAEGDEWKTAFITRYGLYEYLVTPFGLTNAPAYFQDFINHTLHDILDNYCSAYLDDIIIYSKNKRDHDQHVREVLSRLQAAGLQIDIDKCEFSVSETKYLGLIISDGGIRMDPEKVKAIIDWASPNSCLRNKLKELQRFLGFANFYRRFIKGYSTIARPLTALTSKNAIWDWDSNCEQAFQRLKDAFKSEPILTYFDPSRETVIETDASDWASGGILSQRGDDGFLHPVAYFSSKHSAQECNYEIYDKELLAIIKALEEWRPELEGLEHFDIITDHQNLKYFMSTKLLNQRQARWAEFLSRFKFTIKYQPGRQADKPDALSRLPGSKPASMTDASDNRISHRYQIVLPTSTLDPTIVSSPIISDDIPVISDDFSDFSDVSDICGIPDIPDISFSPISLSADTVLTACSLSLCGIGDEPIDDIIHRIYATNGLIAEMVQILQRGVRKKWPKTLRSELRHLPLQKCSVIRNRIYFNGRLFLPQSDEVALQLLYRYHNTSLAGHPGRTKTAELIRRTYIWPRMHLDIARYVRNCHQCIRSKASRSSPQGFLQSLEVPFRAWRDISIDYVTGLPQSGLYSHILVVVDRLTKMRHFIATKTLETEELVSAFISRVWSLHGTPETIISDRGTQFISGIWRQLSKRLGTALKPSSAYHPETDGQTEIANAGMEAYLRNYISYLQDDWADWLPFAEFAINNAASESTGLSPFFANYGYHPRLGVEPLDGPMPPLPIQQQKEYLRGEAIAEKFDRITKQLRTAMADAQEKQAFYANQKRVEAPPYEVGDKVFITTKNLRSDRPSKKLDSKREGPFTITKTFQSTVALDMGDSQVTPLFHHSKLTKDPGDPLPGQEDLNYRPRDEGILIPNEEGVIQHEWRFEKILGQRTYKDGSIKFRLQWTNSKPTWQPAEDVIGCWSDLEDWYNNNPDKPRPQFYIDYLQAADQPIALRAEKHPRVLRVKKQVRFDV